MGDFCLPSRCLPPTRSPLPTCCPYATSPPAPHHLCLPPLTAHCSCLHTSHTPSLFPTSPLPHLTTSSPFPAFAHCLCTRLPTLHTSHASPFFALACMAAVLGRDKLSPASLWTGRPLSSKYLAFRSSSVVWWIVSALVARLRAGASACR